jgi:hypothetical protein
VSLWISLFAAAVVLFFAVSHMLRHGERVRRHDADWGDWPPDQMAP